MSIKTIVFLFLLFNFYFFVSTVYAQNNQIKHTFYFAHDSYKLTNKNIKFIDSLNKLLDNTTTKIDIKGYANNIGTKKYNLKLSNNRVASVKNAFLNNLNVSAVGFGELKNSSYKSRKVDVLIYQYNNKPAVIEKLKVIENDILNTTKEIKAGDKFTLNGILFHGAESVFLEESFIELKKLLDFMKKSNYRIKLLGHICCTTNGADGYNKKTRRNTLSIDRAQAVYNYLIENGIDKSRMSYVGLAGNFPTGRKEVKFDRRVEIEIVSLE